MQALKPKALWWRQRQSLLKVFLWHSHFLWLSDFLTFQFKVLPLSPANNNRHPVVFPVVLLPWMVLWSMWVVVSKSTSIDLLILSWREPMLRSCNSRSAPTSQGKCWTWRKRSMDLKCIYLVQGMHHPVCLIHIWVAPLEIECTILIAEDAQPTPICTVINLRSLWNMWPTKIIISGKESIRPNVPWCGFLERIIQVFPIELIVQPRIVSLFGAHNPTSSLEVFVFDDNLVIYHSNVGVCTRLVFDPLS